MAYRPRAALGDSPGLEKKGNLELVKEGSLPQLGGREDNLDTP